MDCSMPGLPVHHQLPEFTHTHAHWDSDAIQPSHPLSRIHRRTVQKRSSWLRSSWWCDHSPRTRHPGMWSQVGPGIITTNKASGGDGIPVELFQILKDDAVKVLHSICQQIWKTQQWPQDWKRSVFIIALWHIIFDACSFITLKTATIIIKILRMLRKSDSWLDLSLHRGVFWKLIELMETSWLGELEISERIFDCLKEFRCPCSFCLLFFTEAGGIE